MTRRLRLVLLCVFAISACASEQERLFNDGQFQSYAAFEEGAFNPEAPIEAVEVVWLPEGATRADPGFLVRPESRCLGVQERDRCLDLLRAAVADIANQEFEQRSVGHVFDDTNCVMCEVEIGYLFVVSSEDAWAVDRAQALPLLGEIDAPGEAVIVLGEPALVRPVDGGFELVTTSQVCNPDGPRRTTWVVDAEGAIDQGVEWMENSGEDCDDV